MPDSHTNLLYHIVFSTKDRRPLITPEHEPRLYDYIGGTIRALGGICLELNGTEDHIQFLAKLRPAVTTVVKERGLAFLFNEDSGLLAWADPAYDITADIATPVSQP